MLGVTKFLNSAGVNINEKYASAPVFAEILYL